MLLWLEGGSGVLGFECVPLILAAAEHLALDIHTARFPHHGGCHSDAGQTEWQALVTGKTMEMHGFQDVDGREEKTKHQTRRDQTAARLLFSAKYLSDNAVCRAVVGMSGR